MELNCADLEKLLVANWTKFIDRRALMSFVRDCSIQYLQIEPTCQARKISFSRFKLVEKGFLVWIEFEVMHGVAHTTGTIEALINWHGQFQPLEIV